MPTLAAAAPQLGGPIANFVRRPETSSPANDKQFEPQQRVLKLQDLITRGGGAIWPKESPMELLNREESAE